MSALGRALGALAIGALLAACPAAAQHSAIEPYKMIRTLHMLQDQTALGTSAAEAARSELLTEIAVRFREADADTWKDPRNGRAAVVYVLSGGHPEVLHRLLEMPGSDGIDPTVLRGALAYVEGRDIAARELLGAIDIRSVHPNLAGQLALTQAALLVEQDPGKAIELLDFARLLAPGTLVEESALRREIVVVGELEDKSKFQALSARYMRRFADSIYAEAFRRRFAALAVELDLAEPADSAGIEEMLADQRAEYRRALYLGMSHHALIAGKLEAAGHMARKARALAEAGGIEAARASLYGAAAAVLSEDLEAAVAELRGLQHPDYSKADLAIRHAALTVAAQVTHWPEAPSSSPAETVPNDHAAAAAAMIGRGEAALSEIDRLMGEAR